MLTCLQVPLQENESDCGLFLLRYIEKFVEKAPRTLRLSDLDRPGLVSCFRTAAVK
jgi:Ulp1 family protease